MSGNLKNQKGEVAKMMRVLQKNPYSNCLQKVAVRTTREELHRRTPRVEVKMIVEHFGVAGRPDQHKTSSVNALLDSRALCVERVSRNRCCSALSRVVNTHIISLDYERASLAKESDLYWKPISFATSYR